MDTGHPFKRLAGLGAAGGDHSKAQNPLLLSSLESHHPSGAKVHLDAEGLLHWPVLFLYPEIGESDFIAAFSEHSRYLYWHHIWLNLSL